MDREVIAQKLESLRRCLARVKARCPLDAQSLAMDTDAQDIVVLNLTRAVQLCVDIGAHMVSGLGVPPPDTMGQGFDELARAGLISGDLSVQMKKAVGFRNVAVHNYREIDWRVVHAIATRHLVDFEVFARAVATQQQRTIPGH